MIQKYSGLGVTGRVEECDQVQCSILHLKINMKVALAKVWTLIFVLLQWFLACLHSTLSQLCPDTLLGAVLLLHKRHGGVYVYLFVCMGVCICMCTCVCVQIYAVHAGFWDQQKVLIFICFPPFFWNKIFHWTWNLLSLLNFWPPSSRVSLAFASSALGVQAVCYLPHMFYMGSGFSGSPACVVAWDWWSYLHRSQW